MTKDTNSNDPDIVRAEVAGTFVEELLQARTTPRRVEEQYGEAAARELLDLFEAIACGGMANIAADSPVLPLVMGLPSAKTWLSYVAIVRARAK